VTSALLSARLFKRDAAMRVNPLGVITLRREVAARYARITRAWLAAHSAYRRLHAAPIKNFCALRDAAQRLDKLGRGRAALLSDLKALSD
jgi:hypothetical protein